MDHFHARNVFFVRDAEDSLAFYTQTFGFTLDWNHQIEGRAFVFQVSLFGFQLILNQVEDWTRHRAGHGRVFVGLEEEQSAVFRDYIRAGEIKAKRFDWGRPTLVVTDVDRNELFFWLPPNEWATLAPELSEYRV